MALATTDARVADAPSQLALDNLVETLAALLDEARALAGGEQTHGQAVIQLSRVPAAIWHAFPQPFSFDRDGRTCIWKDVARSGRAVITIFCEHYSECPDLPRIEAQESAA